jgi:hypothetical protein
MATVNIIDLGLSGQTGTGTFVGNTSPTLVTPNVGVASATSLTFGGGVLAAYAVGTFTPTFSFGTPGDLSVSYVTQNGFYTKIGKLVFVNLQLVCTPTYTTATGFVIIGGLPFTSGVAGTVGSQLGQEIINTSCIYVAPRTLAYSSVAGNNTTANVSIYGNGATNTANGAAQFPSTVQLSLQMNFRYTAAS